jgi:hypothetical protein
MFASVHICEPSTSVDGRSSGWSELADRLDAIEVFKTTRSGAALEQPHVSEDTRTLLK